MTRDILKIFIAALIIILGGFIACGMLCPAEWHPVKLQGVDCTMKKIKDPSLIPKLRDQEAAVMAEARKQAKETAVSASVVVPIVFEEDLFVIVKHGKYGLKLTPGKCSRIVGIEQPDGSLIVEPMGCK